MVSEDILRKTLIVPPILFLLAGIAFFLVFVVPFAFPMIVGEADACQGEVETSTEWLCFYMMAGLMLGTIALFLLGSASVLVSMVAASMDLLESGMQDSHKMLWLAAMWLFAGYFAALAYYMLIKNKALRAGSGTP